MAVAKAAYKYSGAQDVVSCVTNPHLSSCIKAAVTVALVVATAGEGEVEVAAMNAAEEGGADVAEQVGAKAAESCGLSFTPGTKVLLASGKAVPISSLKPGEKVISTSTKTGKTQAGTIAAVLVHHDTNRYDLTVRARGRTAVIHTTSNHLFWDATTHRWVKAGACGTAPACAPRQAAPPPSSAATRPGTGPAGCGTSPSPATTTSTSPPPPPIYSSTTARSNTAVRI